MRWRLQANPGSSGVQVLYADGDSESVFLAMERVRLRIYAGETLSAPTSHELTATAQHLLCAADTDDKANKGMLTSVPQILIPKTLRLPARLKFMLAALKGCHCILSSLHIV